MLRSSAALSPLVRSPPSLRTLPPRITPRRPFSSDLPCAPVLCPNLFWPAVNQIPLENPLTVVYNFPESCLSVINISDAC
ncbi:hypothetical protein B0H15DRAFT_958318 [Mycena belliarum]|uniref:Uncharacterized protein n=1 Tax=Mycena belliarum TaxID=1033014 RepID=A0AAD6TKT3_9AGAR|nr:hypothetical protein B0H15DRAFT_958423 [Mycena belliae]KAJ7066853.1 hypothetical protein B0H15DRAFT_958318 [Mycena belliae]